MQADASRNRQMEGRHLEPGCCSMATRIGTKTTPPPGLDKTKALAIGASECLSAAKHLDRSDTPNQAGEYILLFHAVPGLEFGGVRVTPFQQVSNPYGSIETNQAAIDLAPQPSQSGAPSIRISEYIAAA